MPGADGSCDDLRWSHRKRWPRMVEMDWNRPLDKNNIQKWSKLLVLWTRFGTGCSHLALKDAMRRDPKVCRDGFQRVPEKDRDLYPDLWWICDDFSPKKDLHLWKASGRSDAQKLHEFCQDNYTALYFIGCRGEEVIHHLPCLAQKLTMQRCQGGKKISSIYMRRVKSRMYQIPWAIIYRSHLVSYYESY